MKVLAHLPGHGLKLQLGQGSVRLSPRLYDSLLMNTEEFQTQMTEVPGVVIIECFIEAAEDVVSPGDLAEL